MLFCDPSASKDMSELGGECRLYLRKTWYWFQGMGAGAEELETDRFDTLMTRKLYVQEHNL